VKKNIEYTGTSRQILELIYNRREVTRKTLSEITGLSSLTVAKIITSLINDGLILETDSVTTEKGRKPLLLSTNPDFAYAIGVDIGAYATKIGAVNFSGSIIEKEIKTLANFFEFPSSIMDFEELCDHIAGLIGKRGTENLLGIGIGITGLVNYVLQTIVFCPNIRGYNNLAISSLLKERFGVPVLVDTSARCMALGERYFGKGYGRGDLSFVSVGHSISAGAIIGRKIFRGSSGFAGELGHVKVAVEGEGNKLCTCGSYNCIEGFITLPEMKQMLVEKLESYKGYSQLKEKYERTKEISYQDIANAVRTGDKVAVEGFGETIEKLSLVLSDYINLFNPASLVLGGGFFDLFPFILPELERELQKQCLTPSFRNVQLFLSELSVDGAIIGSAMQIIEKLFADL
jgi:predicted NBD/HSP70 family sugar kinase